MLLSAALVLAALVLQLTVLDRLPLPGGVSPDLVLLVVVARRLLGVVIARALRIAARAQDQFGTLVASGIAIWFAFQTFVNVGMTVGIMPITGLPLPFVSYGGSAAFADMIAIGVLQSVHHRRTVFDRF